MRTELRTSAAYWDALIGWYAPGLTHVIPAENSFPLHLVGKFLVRSEINGTLLRYLGKPIPIPRPTAKQSLPLSWMKDVYIRMDTFASPARLMFSRPEKDHGKLIFYIGIHPYAVAKGPLWWRMLIAHEVAHVFFIKRTKFGRVYQLLNLDTRKKKAEWLVYQLAREIVAPTLNLAEALMSDMPYRPSLTTFLQLAQYYILPEKDLASQLLHENMLSNWLQLPEKIQNTLLKASKPQTTNDAMQQLTRWGKAQNASSYLFKNPLAQWGKSVLMFADIREDFATPKSPRRYIGWMMKNRVTNTNKIFHECLEAFSHALSKNPGGDIRSMVKFLLSAPVIGTEVLKPCPSLGQFTGKGEVFHLEIAVRNLVRSGNAQRIYMLISPS